MANVTTASLGALESEHGLERVLIRRAVRAGVLIVGGGLMIATGYAAHKFTPQLYDEVPVLRIGPLVAAAVAWLLGLFTLAAVLSKRGTRLVLHEHGLSNTQRHKTNLFLWDEIESVRVSILSSGKNESHRYVIRGPKGAETTVSDQVTDVRKAGDRIRAEITKRRLPRALEALKRGPVDFGGLTIEGSGLRYAGLRYTWADLSGRPGIADGKITIVPAANIHRMVQIPTALIPNMDVFAELLEVALPSPRPSGWAV